MKKYMVNLTYFKDSGKYYSEGSFESQNTELWKIFVEIKTMMEFGNRPGLIDGKSGFHVLIDVPDHPHSHPHLLIGVA